jgi:hypothetical protein
MGFSVYDEVLHGVLLGLAGMLIGLRIQYGPNAFRRRR